MKMTVREKKQSICLSLTVTDEAHGAASLYHILNYLIWIGWISNEDSHAYTNDVVGHGENEFPQPKRTLKGLG